MSSSNSIPGKKCICVWLIGNPTSGGGKGGKAIRDILTALRHHIGSQSVMEYAASHFLSLSDDACLEEAAARASPTTTMMMAGEGRALGSHVIAAIAVRTEKGRDGVRVAYRVAQLAMSSRFASFTSTSSSLSIEHSDQRQWIHVVCVVGGDGSLSEVVNGLCRGTLAAYAALNNTHSAAPPRVVHNGHAADTATSSHVAVHIMDTVDADAARDVVAEAMASSAQGTTSTSVAYYAQVRRDQAVLRHLLPSLIYIPGGTGSDFAKLQLCCNSAKDFVEVLRSMLRDLRDADAVDHTHRALPHPVVSAFSMSYRVDVGRITFPRTGHTSFFINECSIGMSCDVIERGERFKRNPVMAALGGLVLFASSAAVSLVRMAPTTIRMVRLPGTQQQQQQQQVPPLESNKGTAHVTGKVEDVLAGTSSNGDAQVWRELHRDLASMAAGGEREVVVESHPSTGALKEAEYYSYCGGVSKSTGDEPFDAMTMPPEVQPSPFYQMPTTAQLVCTERVSSKGSSVGAAGDANSNNGNIAHPLVCEDPVSVRKMLDVVSPCDVPSPASLPRWLYFKSSTFAFGNGRWYGGGMQVTPHADPTDGLLSCTNWVATFLPFVCGAPSLYNGRHVRWSSTSSMDGERFIIDVGPRDIGHGDDHHHHHKASKSREGKEQRLSMLMEADGELLEALPAVVEVGGSLRFLVPASRGPRKFGSPAPGTHRDAQQSHNDMVYAPPRSSSSTERRECPRQLCPRNFHRLKRWFGKSRKEGMHRADGSNAVV